MSSVSVYQFESAASDTKVLLMFVLPSCVIGMLVGYWTEASKVESVIESGFWLYSPKKRPFFVVLLKLVMKPMAFELLCGPTWTFALSDQQLFVGGVVPGAPSRVIHISLIFA